jgi:RNA polymerase sigma-70 factor (ECF subfamily)
VQQTMITIWEKRISFNVTVSLRSYLYRSVHNTALNKIRNQKVRLAYAGEQMHSALVSSPDALAGKELGKQIHAAINQLPEQCRMVFQLSRFSELKYAEIADHLGISVKTVENHMGKALKLLRLHLKDFLLWIAISGIR